MLNNNHSKIEIKNMRTNKKIYYTPKYNHIIKYLFITEINRVY